MSDEEIGDLKNLMFNAVTILEEKKKQPSIDSEGIKPVDEIIKANNSPKHRRTMKELEKFADSALEAWQIKLNANSAFA